MFDYAPENIYCSQKVRVWQIARPIEICLKEILVRLWIMLTEYLPNSDVEIRSMLLINVETLITHIILELLGDYYSLKYS